MTDHTTKINALSYNNCVGITDAYKEGRPEPYLGLKRFPWKTGALKLKVACNQDHRNPSSTTIPTKSGKHKGAPGPINQLQTFTHPPSH